MILQEKYHNISHVIIAFNVNPGDYPKYSTTDFSCGYTVNAGVEVKNTTDPVSLIKQIQLKLGQSIYPQESYSLQTDTNAGFSNTNDLVRCYQDFCTMTDALRTQCGSLMSFSQWAANPIFMFKTHQTQNDTSNIFSVRVDFNGTMNTPSNIVIPGLYDTVLSLEYDSYSRISGLSQSPVNPI